MKKDKIAKRFAMARPKGFAGKGDDYLPPLITNLKQTLSRLKKKASLPACCFDSQHLDILATILIEFAEDIHNDIGIWRSLEYYNERFFGIRLPLTTDQREARVIEGFDPLRIAHLLWKSLYFLEPELLVNPRHLDLQMMAEKTSLFLTEHFQEIPRDSGIKKFLAGPNRYGWEIKKKLIWVGIDSYLLRLCFDNYVADQDEYVANRISEIAMEDDFLCQECTAWSGLGAIDILAQVLELPEADRRTLQNWYERHAALYKILECSGDTGTITALNLINDKTYNIKMDMATKCPFRNNQLVFGSLVPWQDQWYWSGTQQLWNDWDEQMLKNIRKDFLERLSRITYRYCPELAQKARETVQSYHKNFVAHYGSDLVIHPDGRSAAAAMGKSLLAQFQNLSVEELAKIMKDHNLSQPQPNMQFAPEFLQNSHGVGIFSNPAEGVEAMVEFNHLTAGLAKKGTGLTEKEVHAIRGFIESPEISPAFVHRVVQEYGAASIGTAYFMRDFKDSDLECVLRCHKGHFYRKRYPTLSFIA